MQIRMRYNIDFGSRRKKSYNRFFKVSCVRLQVAQRRHLKRFQTKTLDFFFQIKCTFHRFSSWFGNQLCHWYYILVGDKENEWDVVKYFQKGLILYFYFHLVTQAPCSDPKRSMWWIRKSIFHEIMTRSRWVFLSPSNLHYQWKNRSKLKLISVLIRI